MTAGQFRFRNHVMEASLGIYGPISEMRACEERHESVREPKVVQLILLDGFRMLSLVAVLETLQNANLTAERRLYNWTTHSLDGNDVQSSLETRFPVDSPIDTIKNPVNVIVVGGTEYDWSAPKKLKTWLARFARGGVRVSGLYTASFSLASAGLLDNKKTALHWQFHEAFQEKYPGVQLTEKAFEFDGLIGTSSGGVSDIDLTLELISQDYGREMRTQVAEGMNYVSIMKLQESIEDRIQHRLKVKHPKILQAIKIMEETIESPLTPSEVACRIGVSTRQLERLFNQCFKTSPKRYSMKLRLSKARRLLHQTNLPIIEIAMACGFQSTSHFAKCFREQFGESPRNYCKRVFDH